MSLLDYHDYYHEKKKNEYDKLFYQALEEEERRLLDEMGVPAAEEGINSEDERELKKKFKAKAAPKFQPQHVRGSQNHLRLQEVARLDRERKRKIEAKMSLRTMVESELDMK